MDWQRCLAHNLTSRNKRLYKLGPAGYLRRKIPNYRPGSVIIRRVGFTHVPKHGVSVFPSSVHSEHRLKMDNVYFYSEVTHKLSLAYQVASWVCDEAEYYDGLLKLGNMLYREGTPRDRDDLLDYVFGYRCWAHFTSVEITSLMGPEFAELRGLCL